jgi:hypothetical protein
MFVAAIYQDIPNYQMRYARTDAGWSRQSRARFSTQELLGAVVKVMPFITSDDLEKNINLKLKKSKKLN